MVKESVVFPLLELLPADEKEHALKQLTMQEYAIGATIYERGENCTDAFFVFEGQVKQCNFGPAGDMTLFFHKGPGELFGFYSAITERPQTSTSIAVENTILGRMSSRDFMAMVLDHRDLSSWMLKLVTGTLRSETSRITHLLVMDAPMRVVAAIMDYVSESESTVITIPARAELASRLGMTRETLARHLSDLAKKGLIAVDRNTIRVLDADRLADLLG
jgi:CRP/FNR family transcriptional regulator, cyclic AMP receptor protein